MKPLKFILFLMLLAGSSRLVAQQPEATSPRPYRYSLYLGAGPNVYFNNLVIAKLSSGGS
jgi:hypothetical protein